MRMKISFKRKHFLGSKIKYFESVNGSHCRPSSKKRPEDLVPK